MTLASAYLRMATPTLEHIDDALDVYTDPREAAARAGLRYVSDDEPGIRRKPWGRGVTYLDPDGNHITDPERRERLEALAIPPAWTDVWICPDLNGHILATGRDDKDRKQYVYHPDWEQVRSEAKFKRLVPFGKALSDIRTRCDRDLRRHGLPREKVLAVVTTLLDRTLIRIGNMTYARENHSFGLTSLRDRHVAFSGQTCVFEFEGKSGKQHCIELADPRLARLVRRCRDVPGYHLFQYYDDEDQRGSVHAGDVNAYLKDTTGLPFTAKDFRTWGATTHAAITLADIGSYETQREGEQNVVDMIKHVAELLGNTPAVSRDYYVHPGVVHAYLEGDLLTRWKRYERRKPRPHLSREESALLYFLEDRLAASAA